jgi:hypothetical protein
MSPPRHRQSGPTLPYPGVQAAHEHWMSGKMKVAVMKKRASLSHPVLKYTAFLFEPLGDDRNGVPLALASILGRMSLDPWSEAASLAAMPAAAAAQKLASLIEAMPNNTLLRPESSTLAERLIKLLPVLPAPSNPTVAATEPVFDIAATQRRPLVTYLVWIAVIGILLVGASLG